MAILIQADGKQANHDDMSLEGLQQAVGGYIQIISLQSEYEPQTSLVIDEEGKLKGKPINKQATFMARHTIFPSDSIVGDVVICRDDELQ